MIAYAIRVFSRAMSLSGYDDDARRRRQKVNAKLQLCASSGLKGQRFYGLKRDRKGVRDAAQQSIFMSV